jgi:hypothetical protein
MAGFNLPAQERTRQGIELVVRQALTTLRSVLPAKITELNDFYGDDVRLAVPRDDAWYDWYCPPIFVSSYPAISVFPQDSKQTQHVIHDEYSITHPWIVDVAIKGLNARDLTLQLMRYDLAIFEILGDSKVLDAGHTSWQETSRTRPRMAPGGGQLNSKRDKEPAAYKMHSRGDPT